MVLVGLLPILALAGLQAGALPVDSPPPSPALSLQGGGSATFSPIPTFSPQLNVPSPTFPSAPTFDSPSSSVPEVNQDISGGGRYTPDTGSGGFRSGTGVGRGKGMTNAERMRRGLGILPPTRRMSGKPAKRSGIPTSNGNETPVVDATQFQSPSMNDGVVPTPEDGSIAETSIPGNGTGDINPSQDDGDGAGAGDDDQNADINNGRVLAAKKYGMRMMNPDDGSDMGLVTVPQGDDNPLVGYSPTPASPLQMSMPTDPSNGPFAISPNPTDDDDSTFKGPKKLLAAVPHRTSSDPSSGDLGRGDGNYAPLGMGWKDTSGLLHINLQALIHQPTSTLSLPTDPSSDLPIPNDPTSNIPDTSNIFGAPKQLLSRPGGSVLPTLPVDPSTLSESGSGLPVGSADPTNLLHGTVSNLPIDQGSFGTPQDTLWTVDPRSGKLLAQYVNSDGNTVPTYFVTGGECSHTICLTGDVQAFKDAQGDGAHEVHVLAEALADL
ncbi:hypothetical protein I302_108516 [Kwoniella bestiolae CBS 10118]|uniref:Uncharacterized protein n=1 Tax=Kwoniella bestiolae CBS 10118 TaxID=1296100 RepID=A0A1B9FVG4_9TREE|nr:hypothetical protein I302_07110 [Kwoniella bestiolae CBS 10118]OCF22769.1 hypothetical protein I302_07110 [Kwoniella bestiolae CBS 10118]